jgi:hypothetical protein
MTKQHVRGTEMRKTSPALTAMLLSLTYSLALGQEYSLELIDAAHPADPLPAEFAQHVSDQAYRVIRGGNRTVCEIWLCKQWEVDAKFEPTDERLYPFHPGQLVGILHFRRRGSDFRDQIVDDGWYTLRMDLQPIDGNHEGTSPTRDFLLLVSVANDQPQKQWDQEALQETSALAAGSSHPAMLCLQAPTDGAQPSLRHDEANDWWILHLVGKGTADGKPSGQPLDLVVAGHAEE